jgi:hypothetical protein
MQAFRDQPKRNALPYFLAHGQAGEKSFNP